MAVAPGSRTIPDLLDEMAGRFPDREALAGSGQRYTYSQFRNAVRAFATGLLAMGVRRGDKVAILMGNNPEWIIADLAICTVGGVMVAVNTWVTASELEYILRHSDATLLIATRQYLRYDYFSMLRELEPLNESMPLLRNIVHTGNESYAGSISFSDVLGRGRSITEKKLDAVQRAVAPTDVAYLLYTSGSTSTPKAVQLQHYALIENMFHIGERMHVSENDRLWLAVSLFWGLGCENALFNALTHGACVVLQEHFEPREALHIIQQERCTLFYGTPNMAKAMAEDAERTRPDLSSLRSGGTIGTPEQIMRVVNLGAREICNIYGLTETYGNCCVTDAYEPLEARLTTVGKPLPGFEVRIVDVETGRPCGPDEVGDIRVKGYVMLGYYKDEEKNREAFDEAGFFRTGDLGYLDSAGRLVFRGRIKEMIKTGGINVAPAEVEEILLRHPAVALAYVVGIPDEKIDERVAAVIVLRPGVAADADALIKHCRNSLASYKVPRAFRFIGEAELPLTNTGKLQKNRLSELFST